MIIALATVGHLASSITVPPPKRGRSVNPNRENEQLTGASSSNTTFLDVMTELCNTAIKDEMENYVY